MGEAGLQDKGGKGRVEGSRMGNRFGDFPKEPRDNEMGETVVPLPHWWYLSPLCLEAEAWDVHGG